MQGGTWAVALRLAGALVAGVHVASALVDGVLVAGLPGRSPVAAVLVDDVRVDEVLVDEVLVDEARWRQWTGFRRPTPSVSCVLATLGPTAMRDY